MYQLGMENNSSTINDSNWKMFAKPFTFTLTTIRCLIKLNNCKHCCCFLLVVVGIAITPTPPPSCYFNGFKIEGKTHLKNESQEKKKKIFLHLIFDNLQSFIKWQEHYRRRSWSDKSNATIMDSLVPRGQTRGKHHFKS